jgi:HSP20 family molecular chaperone IbpA
VFRIIKKAIKLTLFRWGEKGGSLIFPRKWMLPGLQTSNSLVEDLDLFKEKDPEVVRVKQEPDRMEVTLDTAQYRPDELEVNVEGGQLTVAGSHRETCGEQKTGRQFKKR